MYAFAGLLIEADSRCYLIYMRNLHCCRLATFIIHFQEGWTREEKHTLCTLMKKAEKMDDL